MQLFECVRDVLQEDQAEYYVLVLSGVHAAAKRVSHLPELGFIADVRPVGIGFLSLRHVFSPCFGPRFELYRH